MRLETFFEKFEVLAKMPGAVGKLRELVLRLAVQGKLVAQNPDDEPATQLLARIREEQERSIGEGRSRRQETSAPTADDPFLIPESWFKQPIDLSDGENSGKNGGSSGHRTPYKIILCLVTFSGVTQSASLPLSTTQSNAASVMDSCTGPLSIAIAATTYCSMRKIRALPLCFASLLSTSLTLGRI